VTKTVRAVQVPSDASGRILWGRGLDCHLNMKLFISLMRTGPRVLLAGMRHDGSLALLETASCLGDSLACV